MMTTLIGIFLGILVSSFIILSMWYSRLNLGRSLGEFGKYRIYKKVVNYGFYSKTFYFAKIYVGKFLGFRSIWITYKGSMNNDSLFEDYNLLQAEIKNTWKIYKNYKYPFIEKFSDALINYEYEEKSTKIKLLGQKELRE